MFILDTDHFSLVEWGSGAVGQRLHQRIKALSEGEVMTTKIAAIALTHDATVLTRNLKDFSPRTWLARRRLDVVGVQKHLLELGAPEPEMPPFDESKFEAMPEVEIDPDDEFHEGKEG